MRAARVSALAIVCAFFLVRPVVGDGRCLPGQSHHGEAFDRGPRWSAYLMGGTGDVHFPVTAKTPWSKSSSNRGSASCTVSGTSRPNVRFAQAAAPRSELRHRLLGNGDGQPDRTNRARGSSPPRPPGTKPELTEREQMYIDALSDEAGYQAIIAKYPDDLEAKAFEVWRIWHKAEADHAAAARFGRCDAIGHADPARRSDAPHPSCRDPYRRRDECRRTRARIGGEMRRRRPRRSATCGTCRRTSTRDSSAYPEAAWQMEASLRTENARAMHDRVLPYQVDLYAHNNEWLVRMLCIARPRPRRAADRHANDRPSAASALQHARIAETGRQARGSVARRPETSRVRRLERVLRPPAVARLAAPHMNTGTN